MRGVTLLSRCHTEPFLLTSFNIGYPYPWATGPGSKWCDLWRQGKFSLAWQNLEKYPPGGTVMLPQLAFITRTRHTHTHGHASYKANFFTFLFQVLRMWLMCVMGWMTCLRECVCVPTWTYCACAGQNSGWFMNKFVYLYSVWQYLCHYTVQVFLFLISCAYQCFCLFTHLGVTVLHTIVHLYIRKYKQVYELINSIKTVPYYDSKGNHRYSKDFHIFHRFQNSRSGKELSSTTVRLYVRVTVHKHRSNWSWGQM